MYHNRIIPCLLLRNRGLVKTVQFQGGRYLGDPVNAVKIYNDCEADELIVLDIDATRDKRPIDFAYLKKITQQCFMPACYGGGIKSVEDIRRLFEIGFEKAAIGAGAVRENGLISAAAKTFGSQSIVGVMDILYMGDNSWTVYIENGRHRAGNDAAAYAKELQKCGAGEIMVNSIDRDGMMSGYDCEIIRRIARAVSVPVIACGGAGKLEHCAEAVHAGASAAAAGSLFVYWGRKKAVLINYPDKYEIDKIMQIKNDR